MPFRAALAKKLGSDMIPSLGSGSEWIKRGVSGDGGDCPDGLEVVCGIIGEEAAKRMAAAIAHGARHARKTRHRLQSSSHISGSPNQRYATSRVVLGSGRGVCDHDQEQIEHQCHTCGKSDIDIAGLLQ
jgi:hypothetical protein